MNVLVDTTIWSLAFRKNNHSINESHIIEKLKELISEYRVRIIGPIRQEILSGISVKSSFSSLQEKLEFFEDLEIYTSDYIRAAEMYNICRQKGVQGSHIDYLICAVSERNHLSIFTLDGDFSFYAKHIPILIYSCS